MNEILVLRVRMIRTWILLGSLPNVEVAETQHEEKRLPGRLESFIISYNTCRFLHKINYKKNYITNEAVTKKLRKQYRTVLSIVKYNFSKQYRANLAI